MAETENSIDIILWGAPQVGKTTALAAYLCHDSSKPEWLDLKAPQTVNAVRQLSEIWRLLRKNMLPGGTITSQLYNVKHKDGSTIRFRDIRGGNAIGPPTPEAEEDIKALSNADGMILFIEWPGQQVAREPGAFDKVWLYAQDYPCTLAITKVECFLTMDQAIYFFSDPENVAEKMNLAESFKKLLKQVRAHRIFPVSVYGYDDGGLPAHYQDEFGRLVPSNIRPYFIQHPFDVLLAEILKF